jgi:hypothetical protein
VVVQLLEQLLAELLAELLLTPPSRAASPRGTEAVLMSLAAAGSFRFGHRDCVTGMAAS